jgi:hypothetical protein
MIITSTPSGALIKANGRLIGRTPYTWNEPGVFGQVELKAKYDGYEIGRHYVEYTGGTINQHLNLTKKEPKTETIAETQPVAVSQPKTEPVAPPVSKPPVQEPVKNASIYISSIPPHADVYINGKKIGTTNSDLKVTAGTHMVRFVKDDKQSNRQMTFALGKNPSQLIRLK